MIEIIFGAVLVVGCAAFVMFLWRMSGTTASTRKTKRKKTKKQKPKAKPEEVDGVPIPPEWQENNPTPRPSRFVKPTTPHKIRVPGLRTSKRVLAGFLLIINFFVSQASLMSAPATQPLFWIFFLNALILLDYLWKTRRKETI